MRSLRLFAVVLLLSTRLPGAPGLILRLVLVPVGLVAVFAAGLVNRYDVSKLSSLPLAGGQRRARDWAVAIGERLARAFEPRRAL